ncbi:MAG: flavin monoamine oxidase family protein [Archangium sp.]
MNDVIIIGGGITGLHAAAELEHLLPSAKILVLEADAQPGGRIRSAKVGDTTVDLGAHYFGSKHRRVSELVVRLMKDERVNHVTSFAAEPACRSRTRGTWTNSPRSEWFFDINGLSKDCPPSEHVSILSSVAAFSALCKLVDVERPWNTPMAKALDAITFQEWIDSQDLPRWIVQMWQISSLGIASIHAREVSLLWWLWYCASNISLIEMGNDYDGGPQQFSVRGGLGELVRRYAASLKSEVRVNAPVKHVEHGENEVTVTLISGEQLKARHVIVAVTPHIAGKRLHFSPPLSEGRRLLHAQPIGHAVKAVFCYREPWWRNLKGNNVNSFIAQPDDAGIEWAIETASNEHGHYALMAFVSDRLVQRVGLEKLKEAVIEELVEMSGDERAREVIDVPTYDWSTNPWVGGGPNTAMRPNVLSRLEGVLFESEGQRLHFASSEQSPHFTGYVEGGMASAERAVEHVREALLAERGEREPRQTKRTLARSTDRLGTMTLGAGYAAMTPLWLARPLLDGVWRLLRR